VLRKTFCFFFLLMVLVMLPQRTHAQTATESVIYNFCSQPNCVDGDVLQTGLIQAADGNFYGTTQLGGLGDQQCSEQGCGTAFRLTPSGVLTVGHLFCDKSNCTDGRNPGTGMVQGGDGNFYGVAPIGGANGAGLIFKITPGGAYSTVYNFCSQSDCTDGKTPGAQLIEGADGNFYGTTFEGGVGEVVCTDQNSCGTIFKITPSGTLTTLYAFCRETGCLDGTAPGAALVEGTDGNFYGVTTNGGVQNSECTNVGCGTVFKITPSGTLTTLHSFCQGLNSCTDGFIPLVLIEGSDGNFYGTAELGGANVYGTIFKITPDGDLTTLYNFCSEAKCADGKYPNGLIFAGDGNFYGATGNGGAHDEGTLFQMTPSGTVKTLYSFCNVTKCTDGEYPWGLMQASDGNFYNSMQGGKNGSGAIFELAISPALEAPVQVSLSDSSVAVGKPVTLSWQVANAFSLTLQQCYAFQPFNKSGGGEWSGLQVGAVESGVFGGSASITPTAAGVYTYALTCGGVESGSAILRVGDGKAATTTTLMSNSPVNPGSQLTLTATSFAQQNLGALTGSVTFTYGSQTLGTVPLTNGSASLSLPATDLPMGTDVVTATYSGDTNYQGSSGTTSVVDEAAATTLALTSNSPVLPSGVVMLTATLSATQSFGPITGTVTFAYGSQTLGSAAANGTASFSVAASAIPAGADVITATYSGNTEYLGSTGSTTVVVDAKAATTTAVMAAPNPVLQSSTITVTATLAGQQDDGAITGSVTFSSGSQTLGTATVTNNSASVTFVASELAVGNDTILATYSGDANYQSSTGTATVVVQSKSATTTTLVTNSPVLVGQLLTLTATLSPQFNIGAITGSVTFTAGNLTLGTVTVSGGTASLNLETSAIPAATYPVKVTYSGDSNYQGSSATANVVVQDYGTATTLTIMPTVVVQGQSVILASTVYRTSGGATPSGTVTFTAGARTLGSAALVGGVATLTLATNGSVPPGIYAVTATYSGDSADSTSTSGIVDVTLQAATSTTLTVTPTTVGPAQDVTFASTVKRVGTSGNATGTVTFYGNGQLLGSAPLSGGNASLTLMNNGNLPVGTIAVTATYSGGTLDVSSTSSAVTVTIEPPGFITATTLSVTPTTLVQGQPITLTSNVSETNSSGVPTGAVTFYYGSKLFGSAVLSNGAASLTVTTNGSIAPGIYAVTAAYSGDSTNQPSSSQPVTVTVIAATATLLTVAPNPVPVDHAVALTATVKERYNSGIPTGSVTFTVGGFIVGSANVDDTGTAVVNLSDVGIAAGTYPVIANYSGDPNNGSSSSTVRFVSVQ
jgi:uncharacterized repeat protein (TIGR03803 family)